MLWLLSFSSTTSPQVDCEVDADCEVDGAATSFKSTIAQGTPVSCLLCVHVCVCSGQFLVWASKHFWSFGGCSVAMHIVVVVGFRGGGPVACGGLPAVVPIAEIPGQLCPCDVQFFPCNTPGSWGDRLTCLLTCLCVRFCPRNTRPPMGPQKVCSLMGPVW